MRPHAPPSATLRRARSARARRRPPGSAAKPPTQHGRLAPPSPRGQPPTSRRVGHRALGHRPAPLRIAAAATATASPVPQGAARQVRPRAAADACASARRSSGRDATRRTAAGPAHRCCASSAASRRCTRTTTARSSRASTRPCAPRRSRGACPWRAACPRPSTASICAPAPTHSTNHTAATPCALPSPRSAVHTLPRPPCPRRSPRRRACRVDGEAMIHAVSFANGHAEAYCNHYLRCDRYVHERAAQQNIYIRVRPTACPPPHACARARAQLSQNAPARADRRRARRARPLHARHCALLPLAV